MTDRTILFISKGINASTRYRALQFFPYLQNSGYTPSHVTASGGLKAIFIAVRQAKQAEVVVILRKTFPAVLVWLFRKVSKKLIFDLDDAIFCNSNGSPSKTRMSRFMTMTRQVDHIFAGNQFLAKQSLLNNHEVSVIPTSLDVEKYNIAVDKPQDFIDLVWVGSSSTSKYLFDLLPVLNKAAEKNSKLRLKIIADFDITDTAIPVVAVPWREVEEAKELASAHIGIAPMIDNDWTRGKCALKVLQYMAAKLPVISSAVGVNAEAVSSGETGYLVSTDEQWLEAILTLANDERLCDKMGQAGFKRVKQNYDLDVVANKILGVLG